MGNRSTKECNAIKGENVKGGEEKEIIGAGKFSGSRYCKPINGRIHKSTSLLSDIFKVGVNKIFKIVVWAKIKGSRKK
jgi:hypothetical protein